MKPEIIDRGRGPEIAGTRITVFDVLDFLDEGWGHARIAAWFRLSTDQVLAAVRYIEEHKEEVLADYQAILDRCALGNPPEIQVKLDAAHEKFVEFRKQFKKKGKATNARSNGRQ